MTVLRLTIAPPYRFLCKALPVFSLQFPELYFSNQLRELHILLSLW